ncbi:MAG: HD-GYP domain-containing protein [Solirubrobacteraceae bacterium]
MFFDLNGFKRYNDSFGHAAGDVLLGRLAIALTDAVDGHGRAYRLGGDEFCVLLYGRFQRDDPVVTAAAAALVEQGGAFTVSASLGLAVLPDDAATASAALQLADERMYADKARGLGAARTQARDVLMQLLSERTPELHDHVTSVRSLASMVGRDLGLDSEQIDELLRAAELHDIGKLAVPDQILNKPGPLSESEWRFMREHPAIGERILNAAPALRPVAGLVRASHERWDGGGYPDGLAGDKIPLGARIVAVCDAFEAITCPGRFGRATGAAP